jgi:hypothetical protein
MIFGIDKPSIASRQSDDPTHVANIDGIAEIDALLCAKSICPTGFRLGAGVLGLPRAGAVLAERMAHFFGLIPAVG